MLQLYAKIHRDPPKCKRKSFSGYGAEGCDLYAMPRAVVVLFCIALLFYPEEDHRVVVVTLVEWSHRIDPSQKNKAP